MSRLIAFITVLVLASAAVGCSQSGPTQSDADQDDTRKSVSRGDFSPAPHPGEEGNQRAPLNGAMAELGPSDPAMNGVWHLRSVEWSEEDKTSSIYVSSSYICTIRGNDMHIETEDDGKSVTSRFQLAVNTSKTPKTYRKVAVDTADRSDEEIGIYSVEDNTLQMCNKKEGLPEDFQIQQGKDVKDKYLYTFERRPSN